MCPDHPTLPFLDCDCATTDCSGVCPSSTQFKHEKSADLVAAYANITTVQKSTGGSPDPAAAPFSRHFTFQPGDLAGEYGPWITVGDTNGPATQDVTAGTPDINVATAEDVDHNDYEASGGTLDNRTCHQFGAQWVKARKNWHGKFSFDSEYWQPNSDVDWPAGANSLPLSADPVIVADPDQTRYLTLFGEIAYDAKETDGTVHSGSATRRVSVGRTTGISTVSDCDVVYVGSSWGGTVDTQALILAAADWNIKSAGDYIYGKIYTALSTIGLNFTVTRTGDTWEVRYDGGSEDGEMIYAVTLDYAGGLIQLDTYSTRASGYFVAESESFTFTGTTLVYHKNFYWDYDDGASADGYRYQYDVTLTLSDTYTAAQHLDDIYAALDAWNFSTHREPLRSDELLAFMPLIVFDEHDLTVPSLNSVSCEMNDYDDPVMDINSVIPWDPGWIPTWGQITWQDPQNYYWLYDGTKIDEPASWTSATLVSGVRTGAIIAHLAMGRGRHFWFNFVHLTRNGGPVWDEDTYGQDSQHPLPRTTLRWEDALAMIYDSAVSEKPGNYPQDWIRHEAGITEAAKYVEAKEIWPSVNFGRPSGPDKFAIDNPTACWVKRADATNPSAIIFTVRTTQGANDPATTDGISVSDKLIVTGGTEPGVYTVTGITGPVSEETSPGSGIYVDVYEITVGPKLDDLPTDFEYGDARDDDDYCGSLRWWTAPGIAGRIAVTTSESAGTVTIVPGIAQTNLRTGAVVDVCDASMSVLAASVTLTRVDDSTFTCTHAAMPTAAYIVAHVLYDGSTPGTKYYFHSERQRRTFVQEEWQFDHRAAYLPSPSWYGGVSGCTQLTVTQTTIPFTACDPAMVGYTQPTAGADAFTNGVLASLPATFTLDSTYGSHWQSEVQTTMRDPFWQTPFAPDGDIIEPYLLEWENDDGNGQADYFDVDTWHRFYAAPPLVEAMSSMPADYPDGTGAESPPNLPAGITLEFEAANTLPPPYYPHGIPYGYDAAPNAGIWRPYAFWNRACGTINVSGRFATEYSLNLTC